MERDSPVWWKHSANVVPIVKLRSGAIIHLKVVIVTDLEQRQNSACNAENTTDLLKPLQVPFYVGYHNLEAQTANRVDVKKDLN